MENWYRWKSNSSEVKEYPMVRLTKHCIVYMDIELKVPKEKREAYFSWRGHSWYSTKKEAIEYAISRMTDILDYIDKYRSDISKLRKNNFKQKITELKELL